MDNNMPAPIAAGPAGARRPKAQKGPELDVVDALIAELDAEYDQIRRFGPAALRTR
jgi:hypothetical protein